ncbi:hypothetical protein LLE49_26840 [Alicyclobacillus tolerans]|nr:hypothetical protein [Alicyclobacillus tolerans]MCF8568342.1 hypothetical protein [Alicyclobacillus tolerans]
MFSTTGDHKELEKTLLVQYDQLKKSDCRLQELEQLRADVSVRAAAICSD